MEYLVINSSIKNTNFHFLSLACHTLEVTYHQPYSVVLWFHIFKISFYSLKLEHFLPRASGLYSWMLSQGENQSCINKPVLKRFSKIPRRTKNMAKIITNSCKNLKIIYLKNNHGQISTSCS